MAINAIPATNPTVNPMTRFKNLRNAKGNTGTKEDIVHGLTLAAGLGTGAACAMKGKSAVETIRKTGVTIIEELAKGITKLCSCISNKIDADNTSKAIGRVADKLRQGTDAVDPKFQKRVGEVLEKCTGGKQAKTIKTALDTLNINNPCAVVDATAAAAVAALVADNTADIAEVTLDKLDEQFQEMPDWDC
ncbi:MAG: hypothetical protein IKU37_05495 [Candidatus Gastranaerophilales bacterium]|nr:hypothetical protein [Candidatus Gastranaerophilales bacterium]